jgi:hypothetical protein
MAEQKSEKTKQAVAKAAQSAVSVINEAPRGFEHEDAKDLLLPRIELLQGLSPAVQEGKGKAGDLVVNISKSPLSSNIIIPIAMHRKYIKWIPRSEGGGIEYQTSDPNDPRVVEDTKWGQHGEKPSCTAYMNFLVLIEGETLPIVLSFSMTNYQEGRKLYTMCKMANCDMWLKKYKLGAKLKQNNKGSWYVFDVSEAGNTDEENVKIAEALYNAFAQRDLNFEVEQSQSSNVGEKNEEF